MRDDFLEEFSELKRNGKKYYSASILAKVTGYDSDHIGLLARQGKIDAIKEGKKWYATKRSLETYKLQAEENRRLVALTTNKVQKKSELVSSKADSTFNRFSHIADGIRAIRSYLSSSNLKLGLGYALVALFVLFSVSQPLSASKDNYFSQIFSPIINFGTRLWMNISRVEPQFAPDTEVKISSETEIGELKKQLEEAKKEISANRNLLNNRTGGITQIIQNQSPAPLGVDSRLLTIEQFIQESEKRFISIDDRFSRSPTILIPVSGGGGGNAGTTVLNPATVESETVKVSNLLDVDGSGDISGALVVGGNLTIDTSTFYVDSSNNRVGILTASPETAFEVVGVASVSQLAGAGLTDCDGGTQSLKWDATEKLFSCGSGGVSSNSIDFDEIVNSALLDANFSIASGGFTFTITDAQVNIGNARFTSDTNRLGLNTVSPSTVFEVQGTSSASYFLAGNTLQVGGFSSAAYSRFGTSTTGHANYISTTNDLLISGDLEVRGTVSFGGVASISGRTALNGVLYTWPATDGSADQRLTTNGSGALSWATVTGGGVTSNSLDFDEIVNSALLDANFTIASGGFSFTITDATTTIGNTVFTTGGNVGISAGGAVDTLFEVGGAASISGQFTFGNNSATGAIDTSDWDISSTGALTGISGITTDGAYTQSGTGANTFSGSSTFSSTGLALLASNGRAEFQGTASASYLLTGNTLQVGGFSSAAYSRFGTGTATSAEINTIDDLLITGALEIDGNAFFDGKASISGNFQTAGRFIFGDNGDTGEINTSDWDISATGNLTGIGTITADGLITISGGASSSTGFEITTGNLGINAGAVTDTRLEVGGTASISGTTTLRGVTYTWPSADAAGVLNSNGSGALSWAADDDVPESGDFGNLTGGLAIDNTAGTLDFDPTELTGNRTWSTGAADASIIWTFDLSAGTDPTLTFADNRVAIGGNASVSGNFEVAGTKLGVNAGAVIDTGFEVGGTASISGAVTLGSTTALNGLTYTWPSSQAASQFLQTNGSGILSWATVRQVTSNSIDFDEIVNSALLDANFSIASGGFTFTITDAQVNIGNARFTSDTNRLGLNTVSPSTVFEVQGTASASYLLTGNTLQVGGFSSAAYSRFGTGTATSAEINTIDDLLITGALEVDGNAFFDGKASISGNFQTAGRFIFGDNGDTGEINTSDWDISATGNLTGIGAITADGLITISGGASSSTGFEITTGNLGINAGAVTDTRLEVGGAASISGQFTFGNNSATGAIDTSDWDISSTGALTGISGITTDGAYTQSGTGANTFSGSSTFSSTGLALLASNGRAEFQGTASASYLLTGNTLQVGGFSSAAYSRFGTSTTGHANYISTTNDLLISGDLETRGTASFGGVASVSGNFFTYGTNTFSGTGSSSFSGSLSVAKGFLAGANNALVVNANATANTLNIVGGNVGIGTTAPTLKLDVESSATLDGIDINNTAADGDPVLRFQLSGTGAFTLGVDDGDSDKFKIGTTAIGTSTRFTIDADGKIGVGTSDPTTKLEVQGTSSASYFLTGNTLQVGGFSSAAYSRFGTDVTDHAGSITTTNDLLISGDLEVNASAAFDGILSFFGEIAPDGAVCSNGQILKKTGANDWDCAADSGSGVASNSLDFDEMVASMSLDTFTDITFGAQQLSFNLDSTGDFLIQDNGTTRFIFDDSGRLGLWTANPTTVFEVQGTASASYFLTGNTLQVGGFASAAYSRFGTGTTGYSNFITTTNDLLISGDLEVDASAQFDSFVRISNNSSRSFVITDAGGTREDIFVVDTLASASNSGITITAGTTQTGALFELQSSGGTVLTKFSDEGGLFVNISSVSALVVDNPSNPPASSTFTVDTVNNLIKMPGFLLIGPTLTDATTSISNNFRGKGLWVTGAICADDKEDATTDCGDATRSDGTIYGIAGVTAIADLAENFPTLDPLIEGGDLVGIDYNPVLASTSSANNQKYKIEFVKKSSEKDKIIGVISEKPGLLLGGWNNNPDPRAVKEVAVTLSGRVPVKVSLENGPIKEGDRLTASSVSGIAMKATEPGIVIGIALEPLASASFASISAPFAGTASTSYAKVLAFVSLGYWIPEGIEDDTGVTGFIKYVVDKFNDIFGIVFDKGLLKVAEIITDKFTTKQLCIEDVCIDRDQLKTLLQNNSIVPSTSVQTPAPTLIPTSSPQGTPEPISTSDPASSVSPTPDSSIIPSTTPTPTLTPEISPLPSPSVTPDLTELPTPELPILSPIQSEEQNRGSSISEQSSSSFEEIGTTPEPSPEVTPTPTPTPSPEPTPELPTS